MTESNMAEPIGTLSLASQNMGGPEDAITHLAWSPDGDFLAVGSRDGTVRRGLLAGRRAELAYVPACSWLFAFEQRLAQAFYGWLRRRPGFRR